MNFMLIFLVFLFSNLSAMSGHPNNKYIPARYVVLSQEIRNEVAEKYAEKYDMVIISDRAGLIDKVNLLGNDFRIKGPLSQERLREILVDCVEGLLEALNGNEEIRPFLKTYPFTSEGVNISVFVYDSKGKKEVYYPDVGVASALRGEIIYSKYDSESQYFQDKEVLVEEYDEALKIVRSSRH